MQDNINLYVRDQAQAQRFSYYRVYPENLDFWQVYAVSSADCLMFSYILYSKCNSEETNTNQFLLKKNDLTENDL